MWTALNETATGQPQISELQMLIAVISQVVSFVSFGLIAFTILYLVHKQRNIPCSYAAYYFAAFLGLDGAAHIVCALTYYYPVYWLYVGLLAVSAAVTFAMALLFIPCVPKVLAIPSPAEYEATIARLDAALSEAATSRVALEQQTLQRNLFEQEASYLREQDVLRARERDTTRRAMDRMDTVLTRIEGVVRSTYPEMLTQAQSDS